MAEHAVLVTGCSSGFGLGIAQGFAARGWQVIAGLRNPRQCPPELGGMRIVPLDLTDESQILSVASGIERLDCLVNNAGYALAGPFSTFSSEQARRQLEVNFLGPAMLTRALLPALARARGRIINISSVLGETALPMNSLYCASKFALEGWSESLRHELAAHGVQVALVEPGGFRTRFGENMVWGDRAPASGSVDGRQLIAYRAMRARMLASPGNDSQAVVKAVLRLARMQRMPLRTRVGSDSRFAWLLRRMLPESLVLSLVGAAMRRQMRGRQP